MRDRPRIRLVIPFALVAALLLIFYLPTLQTIPNGSDHYYMIDVGETQVVLNVWGTLHMTGYPLYTILSSGLVAILRVLGMSPAAAPAVVSLVWGLLALALVYALACRLTGKAWLAALMTLALGFTRTVWIHHVIAEIYTFGLIILALLLLLALWQPPIRGRLFWLALVGGIGVAHHRALAMVAPALVFAVWSDFRPTRKLASTLILCALLALVGFLPYAYLPLRALAGASWVYGDPGTWTGFWDQFFGREAARFVGVPSSLDALVANITLVTNVVLTDVTLPGLVGGLIGLAYGVSTPIYRRAALTFLLSGLTAYIFHVALYTDILSALILPVTLSLAFGWLLAMDGIVKVVPSLISFSLPPRWEHGIPYALPALLALMLAVALVGQNRAFIDGLTEDPTGLETIARAEQTPPGATLMLAWGPRHFAVGFARDVLGGLQDLRLVDHNADFRTLVADAPLVTPEYTFYNQPVSWWEERLGGKVYLSAVAPSLVEIKLSPEYASGERLDSIEASIDCAPDTLNLYVTWFAPERPTQDRSVFVYLLDANGSLLAQADQSAPVYGWRPLTTWEPGEAVRDVYSLPRLPNAATIRFGLYYQEADGRFVNEIEHALPVQCDD